MDAAPVSWRRLVEGQGSGPFGTLEGFVAAVVADHDHPANQRMIGEVADRFGDALFVIIGGQRDRHAAVCQRLIAERDVRLLVVKEKEEVEQCQTRSGDDRHAAVPDRPSAHGFEQFVEAEQIARKDKQNAEQVHGNAEAEYQSAIEEQRKVLSLDRAPDADRH